MKNKFTAFQKFMMRNPILQFSTFIYLNVKILRVVSLGHGGTKHEQTK